MFLSLDVKSKSRCFLFCFLKELCDARLSVCASFSNTGLDHLCLIVSDLEARQHPHASACVFACPYRQSRPEPSEGWSFLPSTQPRGPLAAHYLHLLLAFSAANLREGFVYWGVSLHLRGIRLPSFLWILGGKQQRRRWGPAFHPNVSLVKHKGVALPLLTRARRRLLRNPQEAWRILLWLNGRSPVYSNL